MAASLPPYTPPPGFQLIGQRAGTGGGQGYQSSSGFNWLFQYSRHACPYGADAVQLVYPGYISLGASPVETAIPPTMYSATGGALIVGTGTGFANGDFITMPGSTSNSMAPAVFRVVANTASVPTLIELVDGGLSTTPYGATVPASTSGSGTIGTMTIAPSWKSGAYGLQLGIDPVWNAGVLTGSGAREVLSYGGLKGLLPTSLIAWSGLVPSGSLIISDPVEVDIPVGGYMGIAMNSGGGNQPLQRNGNNAFYGCPTAANYEYCAYNGTWFNNVTSANPPSPLVFQYMLQPLAIMGIPKTRGRTFVCVGDSKNQGIASGLNAIGFSAGSNGGLYDVLDGDGNIGAFEKAMSLLTGIGAAWSNMSKGGDGYFLRIPSTTPNLTGRQALLQAIAYIRPLAVCLPFGANDFINAKTLAATVALAKQMVAEIRGCGVKYVYAETIDPFTTSTDFWATKANQTPASGSANAVAWNQGLRAGTLGVPFDFYIDYKAIVSDPTDEKYWITNGTASYPTDGTGNGGLGAHASPALVLLKAALHAQIVKQRVSL